MSMAYMSGFIGKPTIIVKPGEYKTRSGEIVVISKVTESFYLQCYGYYKNGVAESWHKSGRIFANVISENDIVEFIGE